MNHSELLLDKLYQLDLLLDYFPYADQSEQDVLVVEIVRLRRGMMAIEEMTVTEKNREVRMMRLEIESELNFNDDQDMDEDVHLYAV